jgi:hypothetical protein
LKLANVTEKAKPMCMDPPQKGRKQTFIGNGKSLLTITIILLLIIPLLPRVNDSITNTISETRDEVYPDFIIQTQDGGYAISGYTCQETIEGNYRTGGMWLVKSDNDGNMEWNKTFKEYTPEYLVETTDENLLLIGRTGHYYRRENGQAFYTESESYTIYKFTKKGMGSYAWGFFIIYLADSKYMVILKLAGPLQKECGSVNSVEMGMYSGIILF